MALPLLLLVFPLMLVLLLPLVSAVGDVSAAAFSSEAKDVVLQPAHFSSYDINF